MLFPFPRPRVLGTRQGFVTRTHMSAEKERGRAVRGLSCKSLLLPRAQERPRGKSIITSAQIPDFFFTFLVSQAGINLHSIQTIPVFI